MKTDDNRCRECGTKLTSKNAIDVGYCLDCYNRMMADLEDEDEEEIQNYSDPKRSINGEHGG